MTEALNTLLEFAMRNRDATLLAVRQAEAACRQSAAQAQQLASYRSDIRDRSPLADGRSTTIDLLRCHDGFMQRLEQAVSLQQQALQAAERRAVVLREELLALELRVASVRKLAERRALAAQRIAAQREQRAADDAATQRAWRLRNDAFAD